jgi:hypothetical protein
LAESFAEAWASDRSFFINLRLEVVPFDLDLPEVELIGPVRDRLVEASVPFLEVASSGPERPNRHFFAWVPDETRRTRLVDRLGAEFGKTVVRYGRSMRPPGAPHRSGTVRSTAVDPTQLETLVEHLLPDPESLWRRLPPVDRRFVEAGPGPDRSSWDMSVAWKLARAGFTDTEMVWFGLTSRTPFSERGREDYRRHPKRGLSYLLRLPEKVRAAGFRSHLRFGSREAVDHYLEQVSAGIDRAPRSEFSSPYQRKVLAGCVRLFAEQHTIKRPLSKRTLPVRPKSARTRPVNISTASPSTVG